jgi:tetratricopeptide (TPR) repeat protein
MPNPSHLVRLALFSAGALLAALTGCSSQSGKDAVVRRADDFFAAGDYAKAELEYKNALAKDATGAHVFARLGIIYFDQGRLSLAYRFLRRATELAPDNLEVRVKLAFFDIGHGKLSDARQSALTILGTHPLHAEAAIILAETSKPDEVADARARLGRLPSGATETAPVLTALAMLDLRERKLKEAGGLLERARKADPKFNVAASVLGQLRLAENNLDAADKAFAEAAALSPPRSQLRLQYARFLLQNNRTEPGRAFLRDVIAKTPDFIPPHLLLAALAHSEKKFPEAVELLEKILARDAEHPDALMLMGQVRLGMGENDRAVATLERALSLYPGTAQLHYQLGLAQVAAGNLAGANTNLSQAVRISPRFPPAALALAQLQVRQGDHAAALALMAPYARQEPPIVEARLLVAGAHRALGALDEALKIYRQLAQANPRSPDYRFLEGSVLLQQGQRAEARKIFAAVAELAPDYLPAIEELANADVAEGRFDAAAARLEASIAKNPSLASLQLALAGVYARKPDLVRAEAALQKAVALDPANQTAYALLSRLYLESNQTEKAIANLEASVARNPRDFGSLYVLGTLHEARKNYPAARDAYEKSLVANPKLGPALNNLACLYSEHLGDLDKALDAAQRAREALPAQPEVADTLGWILYKKRQYPLAIALLEESAEKLPQLADAHYHLGMARYMAGQETAARAALEQALKLKPDFTGADEARRALAVLSATPASGASALAALEQALAANKDDPLAHLRLAALHEREGRADRALAAYEAALRANPALLPATLGLMRLHAARKDLAKAIALGREARKLAPTDNALAAALGRLSYQSGDFAGAFALLQEVARRQPDDAGILFDLADAAYAQGRLSTTENALNDALRAAPSAPRAASARRFLELLAFAQNPADAAAAAQAAAAALKADPGSFPALMVQAALDERQGRAQSAQQTYDRILARWPDFAPAKRRLAIIYSAMPEPPKLALELADKAREAFPDDAELARALGLIVYRQGNFSRASSLLQQSARTLTGDAELMYYLGRAQFENKDAAAGKRSLQRALELGLKDDFAREARRLLAPPPEKK